jgi:uncharacterized membrane protein
MLSSRTPEVQMNKGRLESFSDGVFAVAITLLVLDLHASAASPRTLTAQLSHQWPSFAAYVLSFFVIGIIWVNHHALLALAHQVDRALMFYNLLLLMWVVTIPFTTATLAAYLRAGGTDTRVAVLLYGLSSEGMAVTFTLMLWHMISHRLLVRPVSAREGRIGLLRFGAGTLLYPITVLVGLLSPVLMLVLYGLLNGFYILEQTPILRLEPAPEPVTAAGPPPGYGGGS